MRANYEIKETVAEIPKIELHLHLEGAIPIDTLFRLAQKSSVNSSVNSLDELRQKFVYKDFNQFLETWMWKNSFISTEEDFYTIAYQVLANLSQQQVFYAEIFYSPGEFTSQKNFSISGITESIIAGKNQAYLDFGIRCEFIIDLIRNHGPEKGWTYLDEVSPYLGHGVIGIGLGGSESIFPADPYIHIYEEAGNRGFKLVAHAGETDGADSIRTVVEKLSVERVGHGLRANEDPNLLLLLQEQQIPLEMCVMSNVKTGVCSSIDAHPIKDYYDLGLMVTVNSDDPTMFNSSLNHEYYLLMTKLNFTLTELKQLSLNGIDASFLTIEEKNRMKTVFADKWRQILSQYE